MKAGTAVRVTVRLLLSYVLGLTIGSFVLAGPLGLVFALGGIVFTAPLFLLALAVTLGEYASVERRPAVWCTFGAITPAAFWGVFDPPWNQAAVQRLALAFTCAAIAAAIFYAWTKWSPLRQPSS